MISRLLHKLSPYKFTLLLVALLAMLLTPLMIDVVPENSWVYRICSSAVLVFGVVATVRQRHTVALIVALGVLAFVAQIGSAVSSAESYTEPRLALFAAFLSVLVVLILRDVLRAEAVTWDKIQGAICAYLLAGIVWGLLYAWIGLHNPDAFKGAIGDVPSGEPMIYFSFVTLTTLGYGDITPVSPTARTLAWMQALFGQMYLAVLVARLVGMHLTYSARADKS